MGRVGAGPGEDTQSHGCPEVPDSFALQRVKFPNWTRIFELISSAPELLHELTCPYELCLPDPGASNVSGKLAHVQEWLTLLPLAVSATLPLKKRFIHQSWFEGAVDTLFA